MVDDYGDLPALVAAEENATWPGGRITELDDKNDVDLADMNAMAPEPVSNGVEWHGGDGGWGNGGLQKERLSSTAEEHEDENVASQAVVPEAISSKPKRKIRRGLMELQKLFAFMQVCSCSLPSCTDRSCSHPVGILYFQMPIPYKLRTSVHPKLPLAFKFMFDKANLYVNRNHSFETDLCFAFSFLQGLDRPAISTKDLTRSFKWDDR